MPLPAEIAPVVLAAGRVLLGGLYVSGGVHHFFELTPLTNAMRARGVPAPRLSLLFGSVFQAVFGLLLMLGLYVAWASLALVAFTIVASIIFLNFWNLQGDARTASIRALQTNVALCGGLLIAAATAA